MSVYYMHYIQLNMACLGRSSESDGFIELLNEFLSHSDWYPHMSL